ncbi:MAG: DMT family transporter [Candidatus Aenigmarchaeota archaeon]|nr:DMT family transporter [Candidatus Aenigmarchaeota archaeon]
MIVLLLWGLSDILVVLAVRRAGASAAFLLSQSIIVLLYLGAGLLIGMPSLTTTTALLVMLGGILSLAGTLSFFKGLEQGVVSVLSPVAGCAPLVTVATVLLFLGESLTALQMAGAGIAVLGVLFSSFRKRDIFSLELKMLERGAAYGFIALICWGLMFALVDFLTPSLGWFYPLFLIKAAALVLFMLYFTAQNGWQNMQWQRMAAHWVWILLPLIGVLEFAGHLLYGYGVSIDQTALVAPIAFAYPALTVIIAHLLLRERLDGSQYAGVAMAVLGIVLITV